MATVSGHVTLHNINTQPTLI